jgi:hypothetical protein
VGHGFKDYAEQSSLGVFNILHGYMVVDDLMNINET